MSMHPSLKASEKGKKHRSVLKRIERLKFMFDKEQWKEGGPVYGLPKIKTLKIKIKKEKAEKVAETTAVEGAGESAATKETAGAKPAAGAKAAAGVKPSTGAKETPAKK